MKKNLILFVAAIITLLSSCSKDISIIKRRYNNGYYVSTKGGINNHTSVKENATEAIINIEKKQEYKADEPINVSTDKTELVSDKKNAVNDLIKIKYDATKNNGYDTKPNTTNFKNIKKGKKGLTNAIFEQKKTTSDDSELILLVILSLFPILALVAIYIKDGKKITSNFWIDLLLHFTIVGYIIYALLVVLDIINLA